MDHMNFNSFICKSSITVNLRHGQSPLIKQIHVMVFKAVANQYITHLYARIAYALHNKHGNVMLCIYMETCSRPAQVT